jgi:hypothetical protein
MRVRCSLVVLMASTALTLSGCGTLTGIPGHGGGKRFVEEQRLVSASIRGSLKEIDVTPLRGKRVAVIFSLIADEGGGNIVGGRASLSALLTAGTMVSPVLARSNALEVYTLANTSNTQATTLTDMSGVNTSNVIVNGTTTTTGTVNGTTTNTNTTATTTNVTGTTDTTVDTTTAGTTASTVTTNGVVTTTAGTTDTTTATTTAGTTDTTSTTAGTTTDTGTSTTTSTTAGTTASTEAGTGTTTSTETGTANTGTTGTQETVVTNGYTEQTEGDYRDLKASLQYKGLGDYQVLQVPKSDASLLMSLTRNYLLLNEIEVTTPQDPTAEAIVYVTVDVFGTDRKRTDLVVYNNERLSAETSIEMFAADRSGKIIMRPALGNVRTDFREDYIFWAGPLATKRDKGAGIGLMEDFADQ